MCLVTKLSIEEIDFPYLLTGICVYGLVSAYSVYFETDATFVFLPHCVP